MTTPKRLAHTSRVQIQSALQAIRITAANDPQLTDELKPIAASLESILAEKPKAEKK